MHLTLAFLVEVRAGQSYNSRLSKACMYTYRHESQDRLDRIVTHVAPAALALRSDVGVRRESTASVRLSASGYGVVKSAPFDVGSETRRAGTPVNFLHTGNCAEIAESGNHQLVIIHGKICNYLRSTYVRMLETTFNSTINAETESSQGRMEKKSPNQYLKTISSTPHSPFLATVSWISRAHSSGSVKTCHASLGTPSNAVSNLCGSFLSAIPTAATSSTLRMRMSLIHPGTVR